MLTQIYFVIGGILSVPLLPFLIYQGKKVRESVPSLPEAGGPMSGEVGKGEKRLKILTLGESTIAGVGVMNHEEGITGHLARTLSQQTNRIVEWQVFAKSGYKAKDVTTHLIPQIPETPIDLVVIGLGGNDTFRLNSPRQWKKDFIGLIQSLRKKQPTSKIVIANMPPIGQFPAFPWIIQIVLGNLVKLHGMALRDLPAKFTHLYYIDQAINFDEWSDKVLESGYTVDDFFSDGVHPSKLTYELWAEEIGAFILKKKLV